MKVFTVITKFMKSPKSEKKLSGQNVATMNNKKAGLYAKGNVAKKEPNEVNDVLDLLFKLRGC